MSETFSTCHMHTLNKKNMVYQRALSMLYIASYVPSVKGDAHFMILLWFIQKKKDHALHSSVLHLFVWVYELGYGDGTNSMFRWEMKALRD